MQTQILAKAQPGIRQRIGRAARFASISGHRAELAIDGQLGLRDIRAAVHAQIEANRREQERDGATDRQRVTKYRALASAIDSADPKVGRAALVHLAAFEFADEYLEDQHRDGEVAAGERLEANVTALHDLLYELTPTLVEGRA